MPFGRRRPLARAAIVGGTAYYAGKKVQEGRDQPPAEEAPPEESAPAPSGGMTDQMIEQLQKLGELKDQGVLTEAEFEEQKQKLLAGT